MQLVCVRSGSNANCYLLINNIGETLILDCGIKLSVLMKCNQIVSFKKIAGVLVSHEHRDHSLAVEELQKAGLDVYGYMNVEPKKRYYIGNYEVVPFYVEHDVKNFGFVISEIGSKSRFVYATDCSELPIVVGVENWLIECNYCEENWNKRLLEENANLGYFGRVAKSHMSLDTLCDYFQKVGQKAKNIILCHLSENGNADKETMLNRMSEFADRVDIATKNKEWRLN